MSGTMDQYIMADYINRIILPETLGEPCLLYLDEHASHSTASIIAQFESIKCEDKLIPPCYTSCLQPLDVSVNKPIKDLYRSHWQKWFCSPSENSTTPAGNRKKPSYEDLTSWLSQIHNNLSENPTLIRRAFSCSGLYHKDMGYTNGIEFVINLNPRLRHMLLLTSASNFDRDMKLAYVITFCFRSYDELKTEIEQYVEKYALGSSNFVTPQSPVVREFNPVITLQDDPSFNFISASSSSPSPSFSASSSASSSSASSSSSPFSNNFEWSRFISCNIDDLLIDNGGNNGNGNNGDNNGNGNSFFGDGNGNRGSYGGFVLAGDESYYEPAKKMPKNSFSIDSLLN
jgi:hypothetical protein